MSLGGVGAGEDRLGALAARLVDHLAVQRGRPSPPPCQRREHGAGAVDLFAPPGVKSSSSGSTWRRVNRPLAVVAERARALGRARGARPRRRCCR